MHEQCQMFALSKRSVRPHSATCRTRALNMHSAVLSTPWPKFCTLHRRSLQSATPNTARLAAASPGS